LSAALFVAAVYLGHRLGAQLGPRSATPFGAGGYVGAISGVMLVWPAIDETPDDFSADVLYEFRLYSLGTQLVMWAIIGLVFASMAHRLLGERRRETVSAWGPKGRGGGCRRGGRAREE